MQTQQIIFIAILSSIVGYLAVPTYYPFGPQVNVPESDLVNWVQCWNSSYDLSPYNANSNLTMVYGNCPGSFLLLGCRHVGSTNLTTLATGERSAIFTQTPVDATSVTTNNGADWYFYKYSALGFLKQGDAVHKYPCDDAAGNYPGHKLCFATTANPFSADGGFFWGFRCGATMFPEGATSDRPNWIREIWRYEDPCANKNEGDECNDGDPCRVSTCQSGECVATNQHVTCNQCSTCDPKSGSCVAINEQQSCTDGPACTIDNRCSNGQCTNGTPVQCPDCHMCNNATSVCEATSATNGWPCNDNNECTLDDKCSAGECKDSTPRECGQCHECNPSSGCVIAFEGYACDDNDVCTYGTICVSGQCNGFRIVCPMCQACDGVSGRCAAMQEVGQPCSDENACTVNDYCADGYCHSGAPLECGQCHECDQDRGCVVANNGVTCDDDNACTTNTICSSGQCIGLNVTCELCNECDPSNGCVPVLNGTSCSDGDMCTNDTCQSGVCMSDTAVTCEVPTGCFNSTCNSLTGQCVNECPAPVAVPSATPISEPESENSPAIPPVAVPASTPIASPTSVEPGKTPRSVVSGADQLVYNIAILFISAHILC